MNASLFHHQIRDLIANFLKNLPMTNVTSMKQNLNFQILQSRLYRLAEMLSAFIARYHDIKINWGGRVSHISEKGGCVCGTVFVRFWAKVLGRKGEKVVPFVPKRKVQLR